MFARRWFIALPIAAFLAAMTGGAVGAHAEYRSSVPANGATIAAAPPQVVITFSQETSATKSNGSVADAAGTVVSTGWSVDLNERTKLTIGLKPNLGNGIYTVKYTSQSEDGHVVDGSFIFTVDPNAASVAATTAATTGGLGVSWRIWLVVFVASAATIIGGLFVIRMRIRQADPAPAESAQTSDETPA
ncbi:MAG: copper resistance CopC family protein [Thermomicrobiales bacterium]